MRMPGPSLPTSAWKCKLSQPQAENITFVISGSCHLQSGTTELLAFCPVNHKATGPAKTGVGNLIAPAPPLDGGCPGQQLLVMDAIPADIKCIINETVRRKQGLFQAGYREQIHSHMG